MIESKQESLTLKAKHRENNYAAVKEVRLMIDYIQTELRVRADINYIR